MTERRFTTMCSHGATFGTKAPRDFEEILKELKIIEDNIQKPVPSKKIQKKALARIEKRHKGYINADGRSSLLAFAYGSSAELILAQVKNATYNHCFGAIHFQMRVWNETKASDKALLLSQEKIKTNRGLILHVAKRIPCGCLDNLSREAKKKPRTAYCWGCEEEKLFSEMLQCSGCKVQLYCSEECNNKDWKQHKRVCRARAKMDYMKEDHANHQDDGGEN